MDRVMESRSFEEEYKPITAKGYLGYQLLFGLPVAGFIIALIFAVSARNRNVKNFARAELLVVAITLVILFIANMMGRSYQ